MLNIVLFCFTLLLSFPSYSQEKAIFQLHILKGDSFKLLGNKKYEETIKILKKIKIAKKSIFVITEYDIKKYNWQKQEIELTLEKSSDLIKFFLLKKISQEDFIKRKYSWDDIERSLHKLIFLVVFENKIIYGGIFMHNISSMWTSYPVIHLQPETDTTLKSFQLQINLMIRPMSSPFYYDSYKKIPLNFKKRIEFIKIHDFFLKRGNLIN